MSTIRKTITLTDQQGDWIKTQIARGAYTNESEYMRDLVRRDQERNAREKALRHAVQAGLDSGVSDHKLADIWDQAEYRHSAQDG